MYRFLIPHTCLMFRFYTGAIFLILGTLNLSGVDAVTWPKYGFIANA
jgi:hypothetical protein